MKLTMDAGVCATPIRPLRPIAESCFISSSTIETLETPAKVPAKRQQLKCGEKASKAVVVVKVPPLKVKTRSKLMDLIDKSKNRCEADLQSKGRSVFKKRPLSHRELIHGWW